LVEVEVESLEELSEALKASPDRILLDNFSLQMLREAVSINTPKQCELEASGGVDLSTIKSVAQTGVDFISVGAITKSIQAIDLSLLIKELS
jgi:nicotinate-nucleotide pyrophosphorylase (carboxylating)